MADQDPEDAKLVTLARTARARTGAAEGAAVRDDTGRSYVAVTVDIPSLALSALQSAVAAAVSSGATAYEAAAVVGERASLADADRHLLADLGEPRVIVADADGAVRS
jgi:cytidine deaminase